MDPMRCSTLFFLYVSFAGMSSRLHKWRVVRQLYILLMAMSVNGKYDHDFENCNKYVVWDSLSINRTALCDAYAHTRLDISNCDVTCIDKSTFDCLNNITELGLTESLLFHAPPTVFHQQINLTTLNLSCEYVQVLKFSAHFTLDKFVLGLIITIHAI